LKILRHAALSPAPIQLLITDMHMPHRDGIHLGRIIKEDAVLCSTNLVMMTSGIRPNDIQLLAEIGFAACLTKPVRHQYLSNCLREVLNGHILLAQPDTASTGTSTGTSAGASVTNRGKAPASSRTAPAQAAARILLVEDNLVNQKVALHMLEKMGYATHAVGDGHAALEALRGQEFDLVLMDVQMPKLNGIDATRAIRSGVARVKDPAIPIIAMTAHALQGDRERCLDAGMDDYIAK